MFTKNLMTLVLRRNHRGSVLLLNSKKILVNDTREPLKGTGPGLSPHILLDSTFFS